MIYEWANGEESGESVDTVLYGLAEHCGYSELHDKKICGLVNSVIREGTEPSLPPMESPNTYIAARSCCYPLPFIAYHVTYVHFNLSRIALSPGSPLRE